MAKMEKTGIPGIDMGILQPQFKHLFKVDWMVEDKTIRKALQMQAIRVNIDYAAKSLVITYEQPAFGLVGGKMHETFFKACQRSHRAMNPRKHIIRVTTLDGSERENYVIDYYCTIKGCHYDLDYATGCGRSSICEVHADFHITDVVLVKAETDSKEDNYEAAMRGV